jgi:non-specific serine/threonine protein kinase/serine/threonine-protein kinase
MSDERWERIKNLLHEAMQLNPAERREFLDARCDGDAPMHAEIQSLLAAHVGAPAGFMDARPTTRSSPGRLMEGMIFEDRFLLVRPLGEGGMGQVWLADQTFPVRRQVAIKLIQARIFDAGAVRRFESERQSLAIMDHPAIAKVFDAGTTAEGQPYFVMEYVPGLPITQYCDTHRLNIRQRILLVIQACEGVQHAHQKAIIHRDLKPANILVLEVDSIPMPRIIDFGLAKAVATQAPDAQPATVMGLFLGTPGYMSPEQADLDSRDIDTRTDVYSLGVVLYVLLTGRQPFDAERGKPTRLDEMLRRLREEDPPNPSTRLGADRVESAAARGTDAKHLVSQLRGDLDCIALKALERDRTRRYGTPAELAADLRRYLGHEPVLARRSSARYRFGKYVRRHRLAAGVAGGLVVLIAAFATLQSIELQRTTHERDRANLERDRANQERDRATRITNLMTEMFTGPDPSEARGNRVTAREILDEASVAMTSGLVQDPDVQAQMLHVMAKTYANLGLYARAHQLAQGALEARQRLHGPDAAETLESKAELGWILDREGDDTAAEQVERSALEAERRVLGADHAMTLETMDHLAVILEQQGRYDEAEKFARRVIDDATRIQGPHGSLTLLATNHFARAHWLQSRYSAAEQEYRRLLDMDRQAFGGDHPQTLAVMLSLATIVALQHRVSDAEALYREVLVGQRRVLGPEHPYTVITMVDLAALLTNAGRLTEGERLHRDALAIRLRTLGPTHPDTLVSQSNLADVFLKEGHVRAAEKLQRETLAVQARILGPEQPETLASRSNLAAILLRERHFGAAQRLAQDTYDRQFRTLGPDHADTLDTLRILGQAMAWRHRYTEAHDLFQRVLAQLDSSRTAVNRDLAWYAYACAALAARHTDDALQFLREAIAHGYSDGDGLLADTNFADLRRDARFMNLVATLRDPADPRPAERRRE